MKLASLLPFMDKEDINALAGVERVAAAFDVVKHLAEDRDSRNPHQAAAVASGDFRTEQPLAASQLDAAHDDARPDETGEVSHSKRLWLWKVCRFPCGQTGSREVRFLAVSHAAPWPVLVRRGSLES